MIWRTLGADRPLALALAIALSALPAGWAAAHRCEAECEGEDCLGGCTIDLSTCGVGCIDDGCPGTAICKAIGESSTGLSCTTELTSDCDQASEFPDGPEEQPSALRIAPAAEWAVIAYGTDHYTPLRFEQVEVLAASDPFYAKVARDRLVTQSRKEAQRLRQRIRREGLRLDAPPQRRLHYAVSPGRRCLAVELEVGERRTTVDAAASIFVRATVNAAGRIVAADLLHASAAGVEQRLVRFLKANTRLWRRDGGEGPFEAFVVLFTLDDGNAGWIASGSKPLL